MQKYSNPNLIEIIWKWVIRLAFDILVIRSVSSISRSGRRELCVSVLFHECVTAAFFLDFNDVLRIQITAINRKIWKHGLKYRPIKISAVNQFKLSQPVLYHGNKWDEKERLPYFFAAGYIKTKEKPTTHPLLRKKKNNWIMSLFTLQVQFFNPDLKFNTNKLQKTKKTLKPICKMGAKQYFLQRKNLIMGIKSSLHPQH